MKIITFLLISIALVFPTIGFSTENIDPTNELKLDKNNLTPEVAEEAYKTLSLIKRSILSAKSISEFEDDPIVYLGLHNNLIVMRGVILQQNVEIAKLQAMLAKSNKHEDEAVSNEAKLAQHKKKLEDFLRKEHFWE